MASFTNSLESLTELCNQAEAALTTPELSVIRPFWFITPDGWFGKVKIKGHYRICWAPGEISEDGEEPLWDGDFRPVAECSVVVRLAFPKYVKAIADKCRESQLAVLPEIQSASQSLAEWLAEQRK